MDSNQPIPAEPPAPAFGDYLVFVDESGDHSLTSIDSGYPIFVLAFAIIHKWDYVQRVSRGLLEFKIRHWSHDETVLHEKEIRKPRDAFSFLLQRTRRERFLSELATLMQALPARIISVIIDKHAFAARHLRQNTGGAYDHAMEKGLNAVFHFLAAQNQSGSRTHIIVERRGRNKDKELELAFRRFCDIPNAHASPLPFDLVMIPKTANSAGLQLADLIARPIGLHHLRPDQPNRAIDIIRLKLHQNISGEKEGFGLLRIT